MKVIARYTQVGSSEVTLWAVPLADTLVPRVGDRFMFNETWLARVEGVQVQYGGGQISGTLQPDVVYVDLASGGSEPPQPWLRLGRPGDQDVPEAVRVERPEWDKWPERRKIGEVPDDELAAMVRQNHIWLNAFHCIRPTDAFLAEVGRAVLAQFTGSPLVDDFIGRQPFIVLSINQS